MTATPTKRQPHGTGAWASDEEPTTVVELARLPVPRQARLALRGGVVVRRLVMRRRSLPLLRFLLQNPSLTAPEVLEIARMPTMSPEILARIAGNDDWRDVASFRAALVENPRTPLAVAIGLLARVAPDDLRRIYRRRMLRPAIERAARRVLYGP